MSNPTLASCQEEESTEGHVNLVHTASCCGLARGNVEEVLNSKDQRDAKEYLLEELELRQVLDRDVEHLSGGGRPLCPGPPAGPCLAPCAA